MKKSLLVFALVFMVGIATTFCLTACGDNGPVQASITLDSEYNPAKTYDGAVAVAPDADDYTTSSTGAVTVEWYSSTNTLLSSAPINAGDYKVRVSVEATESTPAGVSEYKSFTIAKKVLTTDSADKAYDGTTAGSYTFTTADGVIGSEIVTCTFTYDAIVPNSEIISNPVIGGADKDNYDINTAEFSGTITKKVLKNISATKEYDGTTAGSYTFTTADGLIGSEVVTCTFTYDVADITGILTGTPTIGGANADNYAIDNATFNAEITKKVLKNITYSRDYDKTTVGNFTLNTSYGIVDGDNVTCTFDYDSKNAGARTASNFVLGGTDASNYSIDTATFTAGINKKAITNTINVARVYDGTNTGLFTLNTTNGIYTGDVVTINFTYDNKNAGTDKEVTIQTVTGADKDNYDLSSANVLGTITKKQINNITIVANKEFDDTTAGRYDLTTADGIISGDELYYTFIYNGKAVGSVITGPKVLNGADKDNYSITYSSFTGEIV